MKTSKKKRNLEVGEEEVANEVVVANAVTVNEKRSHVFSCWATR
jgi:hypothetical protein